MFNESPTTPKKSPVQDSADFRRVLALPRRVWTPEQMQAAAAWADSWLRRPEGTMSLRPIQGAALYEIHAYKGALLLIRTGAGKTLVSFLAARVLQAVKPLVLMPAHLVEEKRRELAELCRHWYIPNYIRVESYTLLSRLEHADLLDTYCPDLIVCDEAHKLKSKKAAVTKRLHRYIIDRTSALRKLWIDAGWSHDDAVRNVPKPQCVFMTGTMTSRSLKDYGHLAMYALGDRAPVPMQWSALEEWSEALDEKKGGNNRPPGVLVSFCSPEDPAYTYDAGFDADLSGSSALDLGAVRRGYQRRLVETPGVLHTSDLFDDVKLDIKIRHLPISVEIRKWLTHLRDNWEAPDGWELYEPPQVWSVARQISTGFYYQWQPRPPQEWLSARSNWGAVVRAILKSNRRNLDTALQVQEAIDRGQYDDRSIERIKDDGTLEQVYARPALNDWRQLEPTFKPNPVAVWLCPSVLHYCVEWLRQPGICWVKHHGFGQALSAMTGVPFHAEKGLSPDGVLINDRNGAPVIASIGSNSEGRNLQAWWRNLVVDPMPNGKEWEQLLARCHRPGQRHGVTFEVLIQCTEHQAGFDQALADAQYQADSTGLTMKLLQARISRV